MTSGRTHVRDGIGLPDSNPRMAVMGLDGEKGPAILRRVGPFGGRIVAKVEDRLVRSLDVPTSLPRTSAEPPSDH